MQIQNFPNRIYLRIDDAPESKEIRNSSDAIYCDSVWIFYVDYVHVERSKWNRFLSYLSFTEFVLSLIFRYESFSLNSHSIQGDERCTYSVQKG